MSEEGKVEIKVLRPSNPLAPPPHLDVEVTQSDLDSVLFKLPEWLDDEETEPSAMMVAPGVTANPIQTRVGLAKPRPDGEPLRRSRVTRSDLAPLVSRDVTPVVTATPDPCAAGADSFEEADEASDSRASQHADGAECLDASEESDATPSPEGQRRATPLARSPQERVRNLSMAEQQKVARTGEQGDRVALERLYGKAVWETLLHNSRLTPPEVLRIARMASLPVPLIELIVGNRAWLASPQVRRALLANRRLTKDMIATVLRATPKSELRLMHKQTAYPPTVREAAAKILK